MHADNVGSQQFQDIRRVSATTAVVGKAEGAASSLHRTHVVEPIATVNPAYSARQESHSPICLHVSVAGLNAGGNMLGCGSIAGMVLAASLAALNHAICAWTSASATSICMVAAYLSCASPCTFQPRAWNPTPPPLFLQALRPQSIILMGKNTMMKRSIRLYCEQTGDDKWAPLIDQLVSSAAAPLRPCAP